MFLINFLLSVEVIDATWLQLIVDDNAPIEMVLNAGDKKEWYSNNKFILWIGNPAGATFF